MGIGKDPTSWEELEAKARRLCEEQGLPFLIEDEARLWRTAQVFAAGRRAREREQSA